MKSYSNSKVAIIDTGVNILNKNIMKNVKKAYAIEEENSKLTVTNNVIDNNGHGTNCAHTILKVNSNAELYIFKVTNSYGFTKAKIIKKALEISLRLNIDIINISISFHNNKKNNDLENIFYKLRKNNIIVVVSVKNGQLISYPASSNYVIGVRGINFGNSMTMHQVDNCNIFQFNSNPIFVNGKDNNSYNFFIGNSKATALCSGFLSLNLNKGNINKNFQSILSHLRNTSINNKEYEKYLDMYLEKYFFHSNLVIIEKEKIIKTKEILSDFFKINNKNIDANTYTFNAKTGLNYNNFNSFLIYFEQKYKININREDLYLEDIITIAHLSNTLFNLVKQ